MTNNAQKYIDLWYELNALFYDSNEAKVVVEKLEIMWNALTPDEKNTVDDYFYDQLEKLLSMNYDETLNKKLN